jgi:acyl carrier protein
MNILEEIIYPVVDEVQEVMEEGQQLQKDPATILFGADSSLDSLALVTFIIAVEAKVEEVTGRAVTLADEQAMSLTDSPFRSMTTLSNYIGTLIADGNNG